MSLHEAYERGKRGESFWSQNYTSTFEAMAHADGQAARAKEAAARETNFSSTPTSSYSSYSGSSLSSGTGDGGGYSGYSRGSDRDYESNSEGSSVGTVVGWIVGILILGAIFG
jgi:cobalamin biosynthesis Mg chelatase CobN